MTLSLHLVHYVLPVALTPILALALHQLLEVEKFDYNSRPIEDFRMSLYDYMLHNTFFQGITKGTVTFDNAGDRSTPYGLFNFQPDGLVQVAEWDPLSDCIYYYS